MKADKDILKQIGHRDGMTVPEGYFAEFTDRMAASLPQTPFETSSEIRNISHKLTMWQRVKPYVYMAAMFAGVWCMMKMFSNLTSTDNSNLMNSPIMAEALDNEIFVNDYILTDVDDYDLMDEMVEDGIDLSTLSGDSDNDSFVLTGYSPE